jgi:Protein of unknown function (DUF3072)
LLVKNCVLKLEPAMSYDKFPDRLSRPMSRGQAATLRTLSVEAYQPKLFDEKLTREEADRRIEALRQEIALANSLSRAAIDVVRSAFG